MFSAWAFVTMPVAMLAAAFHDALEKRRLVGAKRRKEVCWYLPSIRRWKLWGKPHGSFGEFCWQNDKVTRGFPRDPGENGTSRNDAGVCNHFRNATYLGSMLPFSEGEPGSLGKGY